MKIKYFLILTGIILPALCAGVLFSLWNTHLICLSTGEIIEADKAWVVFDQVFYEKGEGTLFTLNTDAVDAVVSANFSSFHNWKTILSHAAASGQGAFGILNQWEAWVLFLLALSAYPFVLGVRSALSGRSAGIGKNEDSMDLFSVPIPPQASDTEKVVLFFLNVFLLEIKAGRKDQYHYQPTDIKGPLNTAVYELRAHVDGRWQARRISMGRIGEDSGARSKCFYVVYDDHFVVKIPPEPITDINDYILNIRADQRIADMLLPRECLVPRVSMVLNRIPAFVKIIGNAAANSEQACLEGVVGFKKFQSFLKIGAGFGFFMDFSRHFFLGQILKDCHDAGPETIKEIRQHSDLIWSSSDFADRYGEEFTDICFALQEGFRHFESLLTFPDISVSQKKNWYGAVFLGSQVPGAIKNIPENVSAVLERIKKEHQPAALAYGQMVRGYSEKLLLSRNNAKIRNIVSRLLELLSWLFLKQIAIRDLKPDNLMVAGDPAKYPQFLNAPDGFELGLIDVETAVRLNSATRLPDQPKLGWTPFYATPAHMFINEVLGDLYEDVRYIYFLQDWYAVVAMIFQTVTGKKLFVSVAGTLTGFFRELTGYFGKPSEMVVFARAANEKFWREASREFNGKLGENERILKSIPIEIPRNVLKMFHAAGEKSFNNDLKKRLEDVRSGVSAHELMDVMFCHIVEIMDTPSKVAASSRKQSKANIVG